MSIQGTRNVSFDAALPGDRMARIRRDAAQVRELAYDGFQGHAYNVFQDRLCSEAWPVLRGMLRSGVLIRLSQKRFAEVGRPFFVHEDDIWLLHSSAADRDEILVPVVVRALKAFRKKALLGGSWNPDHSGPKGACCLTTYFIGQCTWEFRRSYGNWAKERMKRARHEMLVGEGSALARLVDATPWNLSEPAIAEFSDAFERILAEQSPETRAVVDLWLENYQYGEIADRLKINAPTARKRMSRFRTALYEAARERRIWIPAELHTASFVTNTTQRGSA